MHLYLPLWLFLCYWSHPHCIQTPFLILNKRLAHSSVLLPGKSYGWRSLVGCSPWGHWDTTERPHFHFSLSCIGEGNGHPLQCSWLENRSDSGAWWAAFYGVAQSQTRLKRLSSSSSSTLLPQGLCTAISSTPSALYIYPPPFFPVSQYNWQISSHFFTHLASSLHAVIFWFVPILTLNPMCNHIISLVLIWYLFFLCFPLFQVQ